jgi:penicillin amidase
MTSAAAVSSPPADSPTPARRRGPGRVLRGAAWLLLGLVLLVAGTAALYWRGSRRALPQVDGEARLPGLRAAVTVRRDALGVPHLQASSLPDLMRAQGYVTAQDRMWQMDLLRRRAEGQLAEAFGAPALPADREMRTLGLADAARRSLPLVPPDLRALVEAYAGGVNAWLATHGDALPLEFRLLRYAPRSWEPVDTLAVGKLLAMDLAQGWEDEALRATTIDRLPADVQAMLFPKLFADDRILFGHDLPDAASPTRASDVAAGALAETAQGSNDWVLSGAHTASGRPLLANDPHLGLGVPSIWSAVHLTAPELDVAGVALPGTPGVILGRNRRIAWGCTNVHDDSADLYVEEFDRADPERYRTPGGWARVETRHESIRVREGSLASSWRTVDHVVRVTRHGPLVTIGARQYALQWTALADDAVELTAFARLQRAGSWDEFREAVRLFPGPSQNFVYADVDGHVGWYSAGRLPIRRAGDGSRPYPGASTDGEWLGFVPFEDLPHVFDPPSGRIVTANNRLVGTDYPYKVTRGGIGPWRAATLFERLESREGWTADDFAHLQGERLSIPHRDLARLLLEAAARHREDAAWQDVAREMAGWDGRLEPDSRPAALAALTFRAIGARVILPRLAGSPVARALSRRVAAIHKLLLERPASWVPPGDRDWDGVLLGAWRAAEAEIAERLGPDRTRWNWGALNVMSVQHPLARALSVLGPLLSPPAVPMGGSNTTPNVLGITPSGGFEGPSMRFIADLADLDDTRLVNFMGQSGHVASEHYADQFDAWRTVETPRLAFTPEAVAREARNTLILR